MTTGAATLGPSDPILRELQGALVESDRVYFELGARLAGLDGATLAWMPEMAAAPGGCVVHRVDHNRTADSRRWIGEVTERLRSLGCSVARVYLDAADPPLETALAEAGFRRRVEIGYLSAAPLGPGRGDVTLRPVESEEDWTAKHDLHAGSRRASDGHLLAGASWVELERGKVRSGQMRAYLVQVGDQVCGAIATLEVAGLLRAKNVFIHPDHQRKGIGAAAMARVSQQAGEHGCRATGIFGVEGKPGNALYRHLGMTPMVHQFEWSRRLAPEQAAT